MSQTAGHSCWVFCLFFFWSLFSLNSVKSKRKVTKLSIETTTTTICMIPRAIGLISVRNTYIAQHAGSSYMLLKSFFLSLNYQATLLLNLTHKWRSQEELTGVGLVYIYAHNLFKNRYIYFVYGHIRAMYDNRLFAVLQVGILKAVLGFFKAKRGFPKCIWVQNGKNGKKGTKAFLEPTCFICR